MKKLFFSLLSVLIAGQVFAGSIRFMNGGPLRIGSGSGIQIYQPANRYDDYNLFLSGTTDRVDKTQLVNISSGGKTDGEGNIYAANTPVIDPFGWMHAYGPYEHLDLHSEDTSNWTGSGPWTQVINLTSTGTYTISTGVSGVTLTVTAGTATIDASASATYGNPDAFVVTGAGTVTLQTDTADPKSQLTLGSSTYPYIKTQAATVTVPRNDGHADGGNSLPITAQRLDALDGVADGSDIPRSFSINSGTPTINGDVITFANQASSVIDAGGWTPGTRYEISCTVSDYSGSGNILLPYDGTGGGVSKTVNSNGTYIYRYSPPAANNIVIYSFAGHTATVTINHIKPVSPAQGELVVEWMPMFSAGDHTGNINILDIDGNGTFLYFDATNNLIKSSDGTTTATVACSPVAGTAYEIRLVHGDNAGQKMQLFLDGSGGTAVAFDGSFNPGSTLKFAYGASAWQKTKILKHYEVPQSW